MVLSEDIVGVILLEFLSLEKKKDQTELPFIIQPAVLT